MSTHFPFIDPEELDRQLASASATAFVLLVGENVAFAAQSLSQDGAKVIVEEMLKYWPKNGIHDLNRTVGFSLDRQYVLLYVKFIPDTDARLGLVFPLRAPLIRIRQDMTHFIRLFLERSGAEHELDRGLEQSLQSIDIIGPMPDPELHQLPGKWETEITDTPEDLPVKEEKLSASAPVPEQWLDATNAPLQGAGQHAEMLSASDWHPLNEEQPQDEDLVSILQGKYHAAGSISPEKIPYSPSQGKVQAVQSEAPTLVEDTQPCVLKKVQDQEIQAVSDITFYLVPAARRHFMIGELSGWIKRWMPVLCETYGWQLGALTVRPDYLKWTLVDFPETLIRKMLDIVRDQTSSRIFRVFPNLRMGITGSDFWAPGYLVDTQDREFTTQALMVHLAAHRLPAGSPQN